MVVVEELPPLEVPTSDSHVPRLVQGSVEVVVLGNRSFMVPVWPIGPRGILAAKIGNWFVGVKHNSNVSICLS